MAAAAVGAVVDTVTTADDATDTVRVRIEAHPDFVPQYASQGAAGADLRARLDGPVALAPGERITIATGIRMEIPAGYEGQVRPRSGLSSRDGITVINAPGTIDSDYRGEVRVPLVNLGDQSVTIEPGMRIAQLVIAPVTRAEFVPVPDVSTTDRGSGGFGSTGLR